MKKIAEMAMLDTNDVQRLWSDIERMLETAECLNEVDAANSSEATPCVLRPDEVKICVSEGGYITVPKVVSE